MIICLVCIINLKVIQELCLNCDKRSFKRSKLQILENHFHDNKDPLPLYLTNYNIDCCKILMETNLCDSFFENCHKIKTHVPRVPTLGNP